MDNWLQIEDNDNNRFRLICNNPSCNLSIANLLSGKLHITTMHGRERHSYTLSERDMLFIVSQYLNSVSQEDRNKLLEFFKNFN